MMKIRTYLCHNHDMGTNQVNAEVQSKSNTNQFDFALYNKPIQNFKCGGVQ